MSLSADERRVLLAAAASPLERVREQWWRTDPPAALGAQSDGEHRWARVDTGAVQGLIRRGLLELSARTWLSDSAALTEDGEAEAETLRSVLGRDKRQLLCRIDEAGELVRRERETTEDEYCQILASGNVPAETVTMWVAPRRTAPALGYPTEVCHGSDLQGLVGRGLVILLAGGTRAVLTGAGQWCAEETETEI